jgi:hypothetical protein
MRPGFGCPSSDVDLVILNLPIEKHEFLPYLNQLCALLKKKKSIPSSRSNRQRSLMKIVTSLNRVPIDWREPTKRRPRPTANHAATASPREKRRGYNEFDLSVLLSLMCSNFGVLFDFQRSGFSVRNGGFLFFGFLKIRCGSLDDVIRFINATMLGFARLPCKALLYWKTRSMRSGYYKPSMFVTALFNPLHPNGHDQEYGKVITNQWLCLLHTYNK